ncbi:hypothetical protein INS49_011152 [Diaporthe citri]|uniref:uncharacterized protein n=1 Tax=Diaporthe citri TaxID=83186 RepID=UPI001C802F72|nr:uncharacterized protein INS49_011152 [Diaporthe citri]KAG6360096.1 hypothetical protein INS49_011152 [Diaporthe citri]
MAILEDVGLEVNIIVNGSPLKEYEDKGADLSDDGFGDETRKCRRYVEVDGDTDFGVQLHVTSNNKYLDGNKKKRLRFCLDLDGQEELEARLMNFARTPVLLDGKDEWNGQTYISRRFRFTTISTEVNENDRERVSKDKEAARLLGLIRVRVWRTRIIDTCVPENLRQTTKFDEMGKELAENAVKGKALSHRATLSAAAVVDPYLTVSTWSFVDPLDVPLAVFYFEYRSKAALQEKLVIPRSREPSPQPVDLDALPVSEVSRLAQLRSLGSNGGGNASSEVAVKREPGEDQMSQRPRKFVKTSDGREAVDLTDGD